MKELEDMDKNITRTLFERFLRDADQLLRSDTQRANMDRAFSYFHWKRTSPDNTENLLYKPKNDDEIDPTADPRIVKMLQESKERVFYQLARDSFEKFGLVDKLLPGSATPTPTEEWLLRSSVPSKKDAAIRVKITNPGTDQGRVTEVEFIRFFPKRMLGLRQG